jgi:Isochorismatase family
MWSFSVVARQRCRKISVAMFLLAVFLATPIPTAHAQSGSRTYVNTLTPIEKPEPLLADYPDYVQPIVETRRFAAPPLIEDAEADLTVRAWRYSYNARGIIEIPNRLKGSKTAVIVVHPWGVDDGQGWQTPLPAGVAFAGTPEKNELTLGHAKQVINPFLKGWRSRVGLVLYSLPGKEDPIRKKIYRSFRGSPTAADRQAGRKELAEKLRAFEYRGEAIPQQIALSSGKPAVDYFQQFPGIDSAARYNHAGYWELPIPVMKPIDVDPADVVIYDGEGYSALREFLTKQGIEHVLLCGYHADMCVCSTTAGFENLRKDFNVFLVADATQATFPANPDARFATNQSISYASLNLLITQTSWVKKAGGNDPARGK